ncbi:MULTISPECIES: DUF1877 family protein [unclassified Streptomyces]|uniref:DUF1877 family protein n=1 Tax=unclassified Streptomyces TaxID=2593676 RepID=UPI0037013491
MSSEFTMRRISPDVYDRMMGGEPPFPYRYVAESGQIAKRWETSAFVLANGDRAVPGPAVAIIGGQRLPGGRSVDQDFGGTRLFSSVQVAEVAEMLAQLSDEEYRRRFENLDFTGVHGTESDGGPALGVDVLLRDLHHLRAFYGAAAQAGDAMMVWLD